MILITYHQNRLTRLHLGSYRTEGTGENKITHPPRDIIIYPGTNYITDPADVAELKKSNVFKASCEATAEQKRTGKPLKGMEFEEFEDSVEVKAATAAKAKGAKAASAELDAPPANPFKAVPPKRMLETIAQCIDIKRLQEIAKVEDRANVQAALTAKINLLRKDAKTEEDTPA